MDDFDRYENLPVIPLGHTGTKTFFYYAKSTRQVVSLTPQGHNQSNFLGMAEEEEWDPLYRHRLHHGGIDWNSVAESLMAHCREVGIYDPSSVRGCGAWLDGNDTVYHAGSQLYVNGKATSFEGYSDSRYRYLACLYSTQRPAAAA